MALPSTNYTQHTISLCTRSKSSTLCNTPTPILPLSTIFWSSCLIGFRAAGPSSEGRLGSTRGPPGRKQDAMNEPVFGVVTAVGRPEYDLIQLAAESLAQLREAGNLAVDAIQ